MLISSLSTSTMLRVEDELFTYCLWFWHEILVIWVFWIWTWITIAPAIWLFLYQLKRQGLFLKLWSVLILENSWSQILIFFKSSRIFQILIFSIAYLYVRSQGRTHRIWKARGKVAWRCEHLLVNCTWLRHKRRLPSSFISCLCNLRYLRLHWNRLIVEFPSKIIILLVTQVFKSYKLLLLKVGHLRRIIFLIVIQDWRLWNLALKSFMLLIQIVWRLMDEDVIVSSWCLLCSWGWSWLHAILYQI